MKVFLRSAGGIGNVRTEGQVDTADLQEDLAQRVEKVLAPEELDHMVAPQRSSRSMPSSLSMADIQEVEISVQTATAAPRSYQLNEADLPDEVLDVLDALRYEITREKAQALGRKIP